MEVVKEFKEKASLTIEYVIGIAIALLVMVAILPTVFRAWNGSSGNATVDGISVASWGGPTQALWNLLPVIIIVAFVIAVVHYRKK
jgi:hypothetical protein